MNRTRTAALLLALSLALVGCGGESGTTPRACLEALEAADARAEAADVAFGGGAALSDLVLDAYRAGRMDAARGTDSGSERIADQAQDLAEPLGQAAEEYVEGEQDYLAASEACRAAE